MYIIHSIVSSKDVALHGCFRCQHTIGYNLGFKPYPSRYQRKQFRKQVLNTNQHCDPLLQPSRHDSISALANSSSTEESPLIRLFDFAKYKTGSKIGPERTPALLFPILASGSRSRGVQTGRHLTSLAHLLSQDQVWLTAQATAATAATSQVQRWKWKSLMSRFRYRTGCCRTNHSPFNDWTVTTPKSTVVSSHE